MQSVIKALGGRRVFAGILTVVVVIGIDYFDLQLDPQQVLLSVSGLLVFIGGESLRDAVEAFSKGKLFDELKDLADDAVDEDEQFSESKDSKNK